MAPQKQWIYSPSKAAKPKVPESQKALITQKMTELIEQEFKPCYIK